MTRNSINTNIMDFCHDNLQEENIKETYINSKIDTNTFLNKEKYDFSKFYKFIDNNYYDFHEYNYYQVKNNYMMMSFISDKLILVVLNILHIKDINENKNDYLIEIIADDIKEDFDFLIEKFEQNKNNILLQDVEELLAYIQNKMEYLLDLCIKDDSKDYYIID